MISSNVRIVTSDSHSIVNESGERINPACDVLIGNHCWIGMRALCLKGSSIADNSVVGAASCLTGKIIEKGVVIAGTPARIIKKNINWKRER